MSLINKMLQDLDARGTPAAESFPSQIRPVAPARAGLAERVDARTLRLAAICTVAGGVILASSWFGWAHYQKSRGAAKPVAATALVPATAGAAPVQTRPAAGQGMSSTITVEPVKADDPAPLPVPTPAPASATPAPAQAPADDRFDAPAAKAAAAVTAANAAKAASTKSVAGYEPDSEEARAARQAIMSELQSRMAPVRARPAAPAHEAKHKSKQESKHESRLEAKRRKLAEERERKAARHDKALAKALAKAPGKTGAAADSPAAALRGKRSAQGVQEATSQRAEGEYRRALIALQDGRMTETVAALEQALKLDPGHEAARQTLVGLLIEAKRSEEAIRHLQAGLALDARQPALAMLLARLQIERGGSGIDTLTRTLPYAGNNADYHAFLAGALQREQRHREAAEQYQAALRGAPANGVWWMGLGMSLQAEKRNAEALEAFQRARASGSLSAELLAFVERRLQQLSR
jgi:MSHA biogenesis protein MshN